jgi:hypothetical protein
VSVLVCFRLRRRAITSTSTSTIFVVAVAFVDELVVVVALVGVVVVVLPYPPRMPTAPEWRVREHGAIEHLSDNLWWVLGSLPGLSLKRNMTLVRLADGKLVIHNAIALDARLMKEIEAWGAPSYLIVPSRYHRLDAGAFKQRYPGLRVYAPRGSRKQVEERVAVDGTYEDFPASESVRLETLGATGDQEGAMLVRSPDGVTVVLNDCMFNMDKKKDLPGYLMTTLLGSASGPRVSRLAKATIVKDKPGLRADFERFAAIPDLMRVIVAHEKVARGNDAAAALRTAATFL